MERGSEHGTDGASLLFANDAGARMMQCCAARLGDSDDEIETPALNMDESGAPVSAFCHSLTIKTSVLSVPAAGKIITDAGLKAYSTDSDLPSLLGFPAGKVVKAADEHTIIEYGPGERAPELGSALHLIPGHCDPTVNLHDWIIGVRDNRVECIWPIDARGALL